MAHVQTPIENNLEASVVSVGNPTKASHYNDLLDDVEYNRVALDEGDSTFFVGMLTTNQIAYGTDLDSIVFQWAGSSGGVPGHIASYTCQIRTDFFQHTGAGPHAFGSTIDGDVRFLLDGGYSGVTALGVQGIMTSLTGQTFLHGTHLHSTSVTQNLTQVLTHVTQLRVEEPVITIGLDTIITASTVWIESAPTEGASNYGVYVDAGDVRIDDDLEVRGIGPHSFGLARVNYHRFRIGGAFISGGDSSVASGLIVDGSVTGVSGDTGWITGTALNTSINTQTVDTVALVSQLRVTEPTIVVGGSGGAVTTSATVHIVNAADEASSNYALFVDDGAVRIDQAFALGGGAAPTFGTIGGSGPGTAAQNEWLRISTQNGVRFVPIWA